jgi:hypothetical protein
MWTGRRRYQTLIELHHPWSLRALISGPRSVWQGASMHIGPLRQKLDRYFVGSASGDGMGYFEGNIAEVRVWNLPRTEEEIAKDARKVREHAPPILSPLLTPHLTSSQVLTGTERGIVGYWVSMWSVEPWTMLPLCSAYWSSVRALVWAAHQRGTGRDGLRRLVV